MLIKEESCARCMLAMRTHRIHLFPLYELPPANHWTPLLRYGIRLNYSFCTSILIVFSNHHQAQPPTHLQVEHPPPPPQKSYASFFSPSAISAPPSIPPPTRIDGKLTLRIPQQMVANSKESFSFSAVGKFVGRRPSLEEVEASIMDESPRSNTFFTIAVGYLIFNSTFFTIAVGYLIFNTVSAIKLPQDSKQRERLKIPIWILATALNLLFAYRVWTIVPPDGIDAGFVPNAFMHFDGHRFMDDQSLTIVVKDFSDSRGIKEEGDVEGSYMGPSYRTQLDVRVPGLDDNSTEHGTWMVVVLHSTRLFLGHFDVNGEQLFHPKILRATFPLSTVPKGWP
ncbi:hypothetical protein MRB53_014704 [Persea americana]|uniref:Uncharacterized protein n=1 Tax=Persea americana TaxID=3435 RepID=A0ACC2KBJ9_PERAE|nr:hypothetical protein MRB53_014704 [Persea americana]